MILFLSKYPHTDSEFRDGFFQRVVSIDSFFLDEKRVYLETRLLKNFKKKVYVENDKIEYSCNIIFHLFFIISLFKKAKFIYIQSIFNVMFSFWLVKLIKNKYVLDLHGVVPEELELQRMKYKAKYFHWIESIIFSKLNVCIAVSQKLANHYKEKFVKTKAKFIVYTILPKNVDGNSFIKNIDSSDVLKVIYSGNVQKWQNIDLMMNIIKENITDKIEYIILTGELERMKMKAEEYKLVGKNIKILSVKPSELLNYYNEANYGFILRDDIVVNNVSCPTKLVEYLNYGIIPIVLSEKIGDFKELGYEYLPYQKFNENLIVMKSKKNVEIIKYLKQKNNFDVKKELFTIFNK